MLLHRLGTKSSKSKSSTSSSRLHVRTFHRRNIRRRFVFSFHFEVGQEVNSLTGRYSAPLAGL